MLVALLSAVVLPGVLAQLAATKSTLDMGISFAASLPLQRTFLQNAERIPCRAKCGPRASGGPGGDWPDVENENNRLLGSSRLGTVT